MTALAILAAAAALSFSQSNDVCVAKVKVSPTGRTCLTAAYRGIPSAPGRYQILGPDGKPYGWSELDEGGLWHNTTELFYETVTIPDSSIFPGGTSTSNVSGSGYGYLSPVIYNHVFFS